MSRSSPASTQRVIPSVVARSVRLPALRYSAIGYASRSVRWLVIIVGPYTVRRTSTISCRKQASRTRTSCFFSRQRRYGAAGSPSLAPAERGYWKQRGQGLLATNACGGLQLEVGAWAARHRS